MLYDPYGRAIPENRLRLPPPGQQIYGEPVSDRESFNISRRCRPVDIDRIMTLANGGDVEEQCRLAAELPEQNHDIKQAVATRRNALLGCRWSIMPGDESPAAQAIADALKHDLDAAGGQYGTFRQLLRTLADALLPGFAGAEIIWKPGGRGFYGFRSIESRFFSFADSYIPKLRVRDNWNGIELPPAKIIFHFTGENGPDPARGGLIRPLAWLHCFSNINFKDLLGFVEQYGMPFIVARVNPGSWEKEGDKLNELIRSFGPRGGGVLSQNTEVQLLQATNNTGEVYFRLLEYSGVAVTKVVLGQTASSGDGGGLSKDNAQDKVRHDILEADARQIEDTVNRDLITPWLHFNYGENAQLPRLEIDTAPPEDRAALGTLVKTLYEAGIECDLDEIAPRLGLKQLNRRVPEQTNDGSPANANSEILKLKDKYDTMGVAVRAGALTATPDIEEQTRKELGLPAMSEAVRKAWNATGGIRQPITLKNKEAEAVAEALDVDENAGNSMQLSEQPDPSDENLGPWLKPMARQIAGVVEASDEDFDAALAELLAEPKFDTEAAADLIETDVVRGFAAGVAAAQPSERHK